MNTALKRILSRMARKLFLGLVMGVVAFGLTYTSASAQVTSEDLTVEETTHLGTYSYVDQKWISTEPSKTQEETLFDNTTPTGGFLPLTQVGRNPPQELQDWASGFIGGIITSFEIGYATVLDDVSIGIKFYTGTNSREIGTEIVSLSLTGLPTAPGGATMNVKIDPVRLLPGDLGYSYVLMDSTTGPLTAIGANGTDAYRLPPDTTNLRLGLGNFFGQFHMKLLGVPESKLPEVDLEVDTPGLVLAGDTTKIRIKVMPPDPMPADSFKNMEIFIGIQTLDSLFFGPPPDTTVDLTRIGPSLGDVERRRLIGKFGEDPINRCTEGVWQCARLGLGDGFTFVTEIFGDGFESGGTSIWTFSAAADSSKKKTEEFRVVVLDKDKGVPVDTSEELAELLRLLDELINEIMSDTTRTDDPDSVTFFLDMEFGEFGINDPLPSFRGTYFFDEFESFRKTGTHANAVDFADCVPDRAADLFCGFVFQAGGGIMNLRIQNSPENAVEIQSDSVFVGSNVFVDNNVGVQVSSGIGSTIRGNTFSGNNRGIDLGGDGVTDNDDGDGDTGANNLQNFPVLTDALLGGSSTIIGTFNSAPDATFSLEFFASTAGECGEDGRNGERLLGTAEVATDADGNAAFTVVLDSTVARMDYVTATATDGGGNTSELSACVQVLTGVAIEDEPGVPTTFALDQNYPNPFNPATTITYAVPEASRVRLEVFDLLGRLVVVLVDERRTPGYYEVVFDASRLSSGVYFYKMTGEHFSKTKSLMLLK